MGGLFSSGKKAAKKQARATIKAAKMQAQADAYAAQAAANQQANMTAQQQAAERAKELLSTPVDDVDVDLAPTPDAEIDPVTGRRRTPRSAFMSSSAPGSGIKL